MEPAGHSAAAEPAGRTLPGARAIEEALASNPRLEVALGLPVLASAVLFAVQTLSLPPTVEQGLATAEVGISVFFALEYVARWYATSLSPAFLFKPSSVIDLISFLPLVLQLVLGSSFSAAQAPSLAFLRLLRVLRLQRYVQDYDAFRNFEKAFGIEESDVKPYQLEVARVLSSLFTLVFIATGLIYECEHVVNPQIPDFFTALYFGLTTLTTVGFGDIYPITPQGRLVVCGSIVVGVAVVPLQLVSLVEAFSQGWSDRRSASSKREVERRFAGLDAGGDGVPSRDELRAGADPAAAARRPAAASAHRLATAPPPAVPVAQPLAVVEQHVDDAGAAPPPTLGRVAPRGGALACGACGEVAHISTAVFCHQCGVRLHAHT